MRVRLRVLGLDLIDFATGADCTQQDDDTARDLSGGTIAATASLYPPVPDDDLPPLGFTRSEPPYDGRTSR